MKKITTRYAERTVRISYSQNDVMFNYTNLEIHSKIEEISVPVQETETKVSKLRKNVKTKYREIILRLNGFFDDIETILKLRYFCELIYDAIFKIFFS